MIQGFGSGTRIVGMFLVLGLASSVHAQTDTSRLHFQVRAQGAPASAWTSDLTVAPGTTVEFRALVTYTGTSSAVGLAIANFQPTVSHWNSATDTLRPFKTAGLGTYVTPLTPQSGSVLADSGGYGRVYPYGAAGIGTLNALRGYTNNVVSGVRYLRIAKSDATNWPGVGTVSTTQAGFNNYNGAAGLGLGETSPYVGGAPNPIFVNETVNVEVARFAIVVGGQSDRILEVSAPAESVSLSGGENQYRGFAWFQTLTSDASDLVRGTVTIEPAFVRVPTPGAIALLGMGGLLAARRRRA